MTRAIFTAVLLLSISLLIACEEREVFPVSDEEELVRYLNTTLDGKELFRRDNLISEMEYMVSFDSAVFHEVLDSVVRNFAEVRTAGPFDLGFLGNIKEALVIVEDVMYITSVRTYDTLVQPVEYKRKLTRYAYFLKLGDDSRPYLGWQLYGFNSLGTANAPTTVELKTSDGKSKFSGNIGAYTHPSKSFRLSFIKLSDIGEISDGQVLNITTTEPGIAQYHFISAESDSGYFTRMIDRHDTLHYRDSIKTPAGNQQLYNLIVMQTFLEQSPAGQHVDTWCIPYSVKDLKPQ